MLRHGRHVHVTPSGEEDHMVTGILLAVDRARDPLTRTNVKPAQPEMSGSSVLRDGGRLGCLALKQPVHDHPADRDGRGCRG